jgi:putative redox protein
MGQTVRVDHLQQEQFEISVRGHLLTVDQPIEDGGEDTAPTPTELFVASLAACVAFYARRYLARHGLPTDGLGVDAEYGFATQPTRVGDIAIRLRLPEGVPEQKLAGLLAVARHCTVHNSLQNPPAVHIDFGQVRTHAA